MVGFGDRRSRVSGGLVAARLCELVSVCDGWGCECCGDLNRIRRVSCEKVGNLDLLERNIVMSVYLSAMPYLTL